ncbi:Tyrosine-protein kinase receptor Tie-1 [Holothuria leucospilota]|uniref:Tyrosine-protein kinase receptor Tie-1 n=1 Tax=Holothuria leucospilota TaxID=206669 RepID=A0A9Q1C6G7_HOLLE|nr:Tyrosine-protein kinase receptor Tie-1 [Holothuria leucospilota]
MENNILYFVLFTSMPLLFFSCFAQEYVRLTLLSINHFKSEEDSHYQCRLSNPDNNPNEVTVESLRTGWTRGTVAENPDPPAVVFTTGDHPHHKVNMINHGNDDAFGVFGCKVTKSGKSETIVSATRMRSNADIVPENALFTQTVSIGDRHVTIRMMNTTKEKSVDKFRWRNNTQFWVDTNFGIDTFTIDEPVELYHAGIYECHIAGERSLAKHGVNLLIVRACPSTTWGPPDCESVCDSCYNGGVCDENTGKCVCAPGFHGENCLTACGGNRYGYTCEQRCTYAEDDDKTRCKSYLFCLVHPFGCRCNTGYEGLDCKKECNENTFGASCLQSCHCVSDRCNRYTGECEGAESSCDPGWTGANCQECVEGYFGSDCDQECHCSSDKCNKESGLCQSGGCLPQWADLFPPYSCKTGLYISVYTKVNARVPVPVSCTAVQGSADSLAGLNLVLSRNYQSLNETNIRLENVSSLEDTKTALFKVENVEEKNELFCQLRSNNERVAVMNITIDVYDLPELVTAPNLIKTSSTTVTISWAAWDESNKGTPPIIAYNLYYKLSNNLDWKIATTYQVRDDQDEYNATVRHLDPDTLYDFSVAAVREGPGGEGPKSPVLKEQKTKCDAGKLPENVQAKILGDRQELVEISWQLPSEGITCGAGITKFTVYYSRLESDVIQIDVPEPMASSFILSYLTAGLSYTFYVTLSTSDGESEESNKVEIFVPVLPSLRSLPLLRSVTCDSATIVWKKWTEGTDQGTPPVVEYIPYHRVNASSEWVLGDSVTHIDTVGEYQYTFHNLKEDSTYEFCVVVVREGYGGEGDKTGVLQQNTALCLGPPGYVVAISVLIPVTILLLIAAAVVVFFKRNRSNKNVSSAPRISEDYNFENSGYKGTDKNFSLEENDVGTRESAYEVMKQHKKAIDKQETTAKMESEYEIPNANKISHENRPKRRLFGGNSVREENLYEVPNEPEDLQI